MGPLHRRVLLAAGTLALAVCCVKGARAEETARCPRCEHRFVTRVDGTKTRGKAKDPCRVCRVQVADLRASRFAYRLAEASDEAARREVVEEWEALRRELRTDGYALGAFADRGEPRLLPIESREALSFALFDESLRARRRASWAQQMADALGKGRALWRRATPASRPEVRATYEDLIAAWKERATLYGELAKRYRAQARDPSSDALAGALPKPTPWPGASETDATDPLAGVVEEIRGALRELLVLEHEGLERLLARTRRASDPPPAPDATWFEKLKALREPGFTTALVVNLHPRRVRDMDLLRSNLHTDGRLEGFFARAEVLAEGLRRHAP